MKIWNSYGSEHSMNLVLIGSFVQAKDAENVENLVKSLQKLSEHESYYLSGEPPENHRFSKEVLEVLQQQQIHHLSPLEIDQFNSDYYLERDGNKITIDTEEIDISAFIKIFVDAGAKVEVYSKHFYPENPEQVEEE
ncbi:DUF6375 family protein [Acinetobacter baumannii]